MLPHSFWSNRQLLMCSICPPWLPACSKEDLQGAGRAWSSCGWGEILASLLLLFLEHRVRPMDNPHIALQLNLLHLMCLFSSCVVSVYLRGLGSSNLWDFSEVGDLQLTLPGAQQHCDLPTDLSSISPTAHPVHHSSPQTHSNSRGNSCWS